MTMRYQLSLIIICVSCNSLFAYSDQLRDGIDSIDSIFEEKPLQLVRPDDDHKKLVIIEKNVKLLHKLEGSVATVAVVGKFHSGKSFLMNQLMRKSHGFGIGPSVRPQTMGIWMWGKPTKFTLSSGLESWIVFLDTEGFASNNVSENYDAKIFAVATLLSSHLLYNSVKIIDQADIDYLELLARRTQLFALRSQMSRQKWTNEFNNNLLSFPPLIWVVQDFVQSTIDETPTQWLHRLMTTTTRENDLYAISLMDIFKSVECHTLFLPAVKKHILTDLSLARESDLTDDYINEREMLIKKLKKGIVPKEKNNKPITGVELAALLEILVNAANEGSLSDVPNRWDAFVQRLQQTATLDCIQFYEADMNVMIIDEYDSQPISIKHFNEWHNQSFSRSMHLLKQLLHGLEDALTEAIHSLESNITIIYERILDINEKKIKLKCSQIQHELELKAEDMLRKIELPVRTTALHQKAKDILDTVKSEFVTKLSDLVERSVIEDYLELISKTVKNQVSTIQLDNNNAIETFIDKILEQAIEKFLSVTSSNFSRTKPRKPNLLKHILKEGSVQSLQLFERLCAQFSVETIYESKLAILKVKLSEKTIDIEKENEKIANNYIESECAKLIEQFRQRIGDNYVVLPVNNSELESRLKLEITKTIRDFNDILSDFEIYQIYSVNFNKFKEKLSELCDQKRNENVKAFAKEVETPLLTSKKIILLSEDKYSTVFSFKQFMRSVCLLNLDEGKPKYWPLKLKLEIIEQFISGDGELLRSVQSKMGIWSSIIGFLQWILWLFNLA